MGRLFQWIRSAAASRGANRRSPAASRRRRLAFERCESRIALSAADADLTQFVVDKEDHVIAIDEGGLVSLSFTAADFVNWSAAKSQFDGIAVGHLTNFIIRTEPLVTLPGTSAASTRRVIDDWEFAFSGTLVQSGSGAVVENAFGMFDSTAEGDYGLSLNGSELTSPSVNSDLSVIPTPMPTPSEQPGVGNENEGGQIALTPFVAPTGLTLSNGHGSSGIARAKPGMEELREAPAARTSDASRLEGLRGRAVVYEVANVANGDLPPNDSSGGSDAVDEREAIQLAAFSALTPAAFDDEIDRGAQQSDVELDASSPEEMPAAEALVMADLAFNGLTPIKFLTLNGDDAANSLTLNAAGNLADRDEVFADWQSAESFDSPPASLAAPNDGRDRRMLGIGVAMALSYLPLRKAWRRRGEQAIRQELPRRRQIS